MFGAGILARPAVALLGAAGLFVVGCLGGYFFRAQQVPGEIAVAVAGVVKAEAGCLEGSECAKAADLRVAQETVLVAAAVAAADAERAAERAELEARVAAAEEAARGSARGALARLRAAEARGRDALGSSQECAVWASQPVPCPLSQ
jgi:hypothetical protein